MGAVRLLLVTAIRQAARRWARSAPPRAALATVPAAWYEWMSAGKRWRRVIPARFTDYSNALP